MPTPAIPYPAALSHDGTELWVSADVATTGHLDNTVRESVAQGFQVRIYLNRTPPTSPSIPVSNTPITSVHQLGPLFQHLDASTQFAVEATCIGSPSLKR